MIKGKNTGILDINNLWLSFTIQHPQNKFIDKKCSQNRIKKYVAGGEYEGVFLKPKFGDASGVRGAARLGRTTNYW